MSGGSVDRGAWAKVVHELLDEMPKRKKAPLARKLGFSERTIDRWLAEDVDVAEASVRQVASRTGRSAMDLLIRVGVYQRAEMPAPEIPPEDAWIVETVRSSGIGRREQDLIIAVELDRARREREEKRQRIKEQIELVGGGPDTDTSQ